MRIARWSWACLAAASVPLLAGCVSAHEGRGADREMAERLGRLENHVEELTHGFRQRHQALEEVRHQQREWGGHLERMAHRLEQFMERVERLEVALRRGAAAGGRGGDGGPGAGDAGEWVRKAPAGHRGNLERLEKKMVDVRRHLEELEEVREKVRGTDEGKLKEVERRMEEVRRQMEELEEARGKVRRELEEMEERRR